MDPGAGCKHVRSLQGSRRKNRSDSLQKPGACQNSLNKRFLIRKLDKDLNREAFIEDFCFSGKWAIKTAGWKVHLLDLMEVLIPLHISEGSFENTSERQEMQCSIPSITHGAPWGNLMNFCYLYLSSDRGAGGHSIKSNAY
ncbi:hypothetical protein CDAR_116101 [Caerostris darwini]|uniref:Uncharacterized protein n=1 Tax=Caerostris darwini TaxID=1538125 RepID=A0AAV4QPM3_9ARAC|nr:hypothetical protein CDAR_116101 [Caerostris darwini]